MPGRVAAVRDAGRMADLDPDAAGAKLMMDARVLRSMLREDVVLDPNDALVHYLRVTMDTLGEILDEIATAYRPVNAGAAGRFDAAADASRRSSQELSAAVDPSTT
ncbi:hypothetical protein [Actinocatenispora comari]|uniref:Uncharacterized protein n=1 Tax=Actinocatenispora comari TaxID=2807577 RepID=A0A8J4A5W5_9ACTN|nr:hypothetical protein [Actinocatenispora comari]GIL25471.1 hypothetical protein NUM_07260 [Actinocatenispora comari]